MVPINPKKIAAIQYAGDMLALGIKPSFSTKYELDTYGKDIEGAENIGDRPVNMEKLLDYAPDLIITDDTGDTVETEQLSAIAPTLTFRFWTKDPFEHLNKIADLFGKQAEAKAWLQQYNNCVQEVKNQINAKEGETALLLIVSGKDMGISGIRNGGYTLYEQLGFKTPESMEPLLAKDTNFGFEPITLKGLTTYDTDNLFVEMDDTTELTKETFQQLQKSSIWKTCLFETRHHYCQ